MKALASALFLTLASAKEIELFAWQDSDVWGDATSDNYVMWTATSQW